MAADKNKVGSLEEEALKRKQRLKTLKRKHSSSQDEDSAQNTIQESIVLPKPIFRSYKPQDENLKENTLPEAKAGDVESEIKEQLNAAKVKVVIEELDITNLAPRKPDWDLKRDVAKKLERLERRTQKAIAELIREKLKQRQEDLAALVNMGTTESAQNKDDND